MLGRQAAELLSPGSPFAAFSQSSRLPAAARVLLVAEPRCYLFPRACVNPSQHDPSPLRDLMESGLPLAQVITNLRATGLTHLLVNRAELRRLGPAYPVAPWRSTAGRRRWLELERLLGPPLLVRGPVTILALPPTVSEHGEHPSR